MCKYRDIWLLVFNNKKSGFMETLLNLVIFCINKVQATKKASDEYLLKSSIFKS